MHSDQIEPYLHCNRHDICETCAYHHSDHCPCPMDTLAVLVVEAIEAVERRRRQAPGQAFVAAVPEGSQAATREIADAFEEATETWTGCDWHTVFGKAGRNLQGLTAADAAAQAVKAKGTVDEAEWQAAASWLADVEKRREADEEAARAVVAAEAGDGIKLSGTQSGHGPWSSTPADRSGILCTPGNAFIRSYQMRPKPHIKPDSRIPIEIEAAS